MDYESISAHELANACCNTHNNAAWREFYCRYHRAITVAAAAIVNLHRDHFHSALDEIVSSTYLRMFVNDCRYLRRFAPESDSEARHLLQDLATKTARNYFRDMQRKKRFPEARFVSLDLDLLESSGMGTADALEQRVIVGDLLRRLSCMLASSRSAAQDETVFRCRFQQGLTINEIAAAPDIRLNPRGVEASLRRSLRKLRTQLGTR